MNIIVQQSRLRDGSRKVVSVTEVLGCDGGEVQLREIFTFRQEGIDEDGKVIGHFSPTGAMPHFLEHLASEGEVLPAEMFAAVE